MTPSAEISEGFARPLNRRRNVKGIYVAIVKRKHKALQKPNRWFESNWRLHLIALAFDFYEKICDNKRKKEGVYGTY